MADPKLEPQYAAALQTLAAVGYDPDALVNAALCSFLGREFPELTTPEFQHPILQASFMLQHGIRQASRQGRENLVFRRTGNQVHVEVFHDGEAPQKIIQYHSRFMEHLLVRVRYLREHEPGAEYAFDGAAPVAVRCREVDDETVHLVVRHISRTTP